MKNITFEEAMNGKTYEHTFTGHDGIEHNLKAWCETDDEEVLKWSAMWSVQDDARSDGEVRTHNQDDESEMLTELEHLSKKIESEFPGIRIGFDFADQCFKQV